MTDTHRFDVADSGRLVVKIQAGRIDVSEGPPGVVRVELTSKSPEPIDVFQAGDTVNVIDNRHGWIVRGTVRVAAQVPPGCDVEVGSASADLVVDVDLGELTFRTASGDLSFRRAASVEAKSASGTIRGDRVGGDFRFASASGDVYVDRVEGRVDAGLASGDVRVGEVHGDLRGNSASGDLRVDRFLGDQAELKSVSGDIVVGFPKGVTLDANITTLSGDVRLPDRASESGGGGGRRRVRFNAKTVSGDVRISTFSE